MVLACFHRRLEMFMAAACPASARPHTENYASPANGLLQERHIGAAVVVRLEAE